MNESQTDQHQLAIARNQGLARRPFAPLTPEQDFNRLAASFAGIVLFFCFSFVSLVIAGLQAFR